MLRAKSKMKTLKMMAFAIAVFMMPGIVQAQNFPTDGIAGSWKGTLTPKPLQFSGKILPASMTVIAAAPGNTEAGQLRWGPRESCVFKLRYLGGFISNGNNTYAFELSSDGPLENMHSMCYIAQAGDLHVTVNGDNVTLLMIARAGGVGNSMNGTARKVGP